jgi:hypothetical protein
MKTRQTASPAMEPIDYEKLSVQDARTAIHDHHRVYQKNWLSERLPGGAELLLDTTSAWLVELPAAVRPVELARRFPRIANNLARLWRRPREWEHAVTELLIVRRGDVVRQGFPPVVARELARLSTYCAALHPTVDTSTEWV